jgi:hypothetical protein
LRDRSGEYRIVVKSIPCVDLLGPIRARTEKVKRLIRARMEAGEFSQLHFQQKHP